MKHLLCFLAAASFSTLLSADTKVWLDETDLSMMTSGWQKARANTSVNGNPLKAGRKKFERGVGTHADSIMVFETNGNALSFEAEVAVDDEEINRGHGSVVFQVIADKKIVADTGVMKSREPPKKISVDLTGAKTVMLVVTGGGDGIDFDHADWCNAFFTVKDGTTIKPVKGGNFSDQLGIISPAIPAEPRINGAGAFGVRPTHPILYTLPVSGDRPMTLSAAGLPEGAKFDPATGMLSGAVAKPGHYPITFTAKNSKGSASRTIDLVVGETIALTPPMGWNSWNCFAGKVSDVNIRQAADAMKKSGLINHGWTYINIDDFWQNRPGETHDQTLIGPERDANGKIVCNKRFPDMKALTAYVHGLGLKIGLYSSPGPKTCGGCTGSYQHEWQDAETYAEWGFDYLKHDWCSYGGVPHESGLKGLMKPYILMSTALRAQNRDIILSLCQYGMGNVSAWGKMSGGQCWRTTGDIVDTWGSMINIANAQDGLELFTGPGSWNDPDMLIVGMVGWGNLHPTRLTPNEQYTHLSLWCLFSSPLLIGCDMTQLDAFTLSLLTNDEVLAINQDLLGKAAGRVARDENFDIWARPLADGGTAVGIVNKSLFPQNGIFKLKDAGLSGKYRMRDLWRQKDLGEIEGEYHLEVLGHATQFIKLSPVAAQ